MSDDRPPLVCAFESRRADDMAALIERSGGTALLAPAMREIPLEDNPVALACVRRLIAGEFSALVLLTGVGTEALFDVAGRDGLRDELLSALQRIPLVIRGPKPAAVLQRTGLRAAVRAAEPNTWRELLEALDQSSVTLSGAEIAVQEYGIPNPRLYEALRDRGASVTPVPVYRWALPRDPGPLVAAIRRIQAGEVDLVLFTSANQVNNVMTVAEQSGDPDALRTAAESCVVASVGPTCSEALRDCGWPVHFEARPPKMGPLVRGAIEFWKTQ